MKQGYKALTGVYASKHYKVTSFSSTVGVHACTLPPYMSKLRVTAEG